MSSIRVVSQGTWYQNGSSYFHAHLVQRTSQGIVVRWLGALSRCYTVWRKHDPANPDAGWQAVHQCTVGPLYGTLEWIDPDSRNTLGTANDFIEVEEP